MATTNQNYANLLTFRFYSSLISPPRVKPSEIPGIRTFSKGKAKIRQPNDCVGRCVQSKLTKINMTIQFTTDSFGDATTPQSEYKRCVNASVNASFNEEETSECLTIADYGRLVHQFGLDNTPYHTFSLVPSVGAEPNTLVFKGESFIMNNAGLCDHCLLADKVCSSNKNRNYTQTHKVCQNRIGYSSTNPGPNFPTVSPDIHEYISSGYNTSWIFKEALLHIIGAGGLQFETNCACEGIPPTKPSNSRVLLSPVVSTGITGKTTTTIGSRPATQATQSVVRRSDLY